MALTLNGTKQFPEARALQRVGEIRTQSTPARVKEIFEQIAEAISDTSVEVREYMKMHPEFQDLGGRMLQEWEAGRELSLRLPVPKAGVVTAPER